MDDVIFGVNVVTFLFFLPVLTALFPFREEDDVVDGVDGVLLPEEKDEEEEEGTSIVVVNCFKRLV